MWLLIRGCLLCSTVIMSIMATSIGSSISCICKSLDSFFKIQLSERGVVYYYNGGNDVLVVLPMRYSKAFCYACLPGVFDKLLGHHSKILMPSTVKYQS